VTDREHAFTKASASILKARLAEHQARAHQAQVHAIYINGTPAAEGWPDAAKVVEDTLRDSNMAEALFHLGEVERFKKAIAALDTAE
jgi:hypothetical protein